MDKKHYDGWLYTLWCDVCAIYTLGRLDLRARRRHRRLVRH